MPKRKSDDDQHDDKTVTSTTGEVEPLTESAPDPAPQPAPDQAHLASLVDEMLKDPAFDPGGTYRRRLAAYSMGLDEHGAPMRRD